MKKGKLNEPLKILFIITAILIYLMLQLVVIDRYYGYFMNQTTILSTLSLISIITILLKGLKNIDTAKILTIIVSISYFPHLIAVIFNIGSKYPYVYLITILLLTSVRILIISRETKFKNFYLLSSVSAIAIIICLIYPFYGKGANEIEKANLTTYWISWIIMEVLLAITLFVNKPIPKIKSQNNVKNHLIFNIPFTLLIIFQLLSITVTTTNFENGISKDWLNVYHNVCTHKNCECPTPAFPEEFCVHNEKVNGAHAFSFNVIDKRFAIDKNNIYKIIEKPIPSAYDYTISYIEETIPLGPETYKNKDISIEIEDGDKKYEFKWDGKKYIVEEVID